MKINLNDFKKVKENDSGIVLKHARHGHTLMVAKNSLSQKMRSEFASMPIHMADGGEVDKPEEGYLDKISGLIDQVAPPIQPAQQQPSMPVDPDTQAKRELYNKYVANNFGPDSSQAQKAFTGAGVLFENGQPPVNFNKDLWNQAATQYDSQKQAQMVQGQQAQMDQYQNAMQENAARAQAGLPQIPMPQAPQIQLASFNPQNPGQMPVPEGAQQVQQPEQVNPLISSQQNMAQGMARGFKEQEAGIWNQANAQTNYGKSLVSAAQQQVMSVNELKKHQEDMFNKLVGEREALMKDYNNGNINPTHYMDNMSTWGKVRTAIGLMISGGGAAMAHQPNLAYDYLKGQIDRDIEAQKTNMDKRKNLLAANYQMFGNMRDAMQMTRAMQNDIYSAEIAKAGANAQGPLAKAQAQMAVGQLHRESAQIMQGLALKLGAMQGIRGGNVDPAMAIQFLASTPEEKSKLMGDLQDMQNTVKFRDNILSAWDKLDQINNVGNRLTSPIDSSRQVNAIKEPLTASLSKGTAGRFTQADSGMIDSLWPAAGDSDQTRALKRSSMAKIVGEKMNFPSLKPYGITPDNYGRYNGHGESKIQFTPRGK